MKVPVPVKGSRMWTPLSERRLPKYLRRAPSAERRMKSTTSMGVKTMPSFSTVVLKAVAKKVS